MKKLLLLILTLSLLLTCSPMAYTAGATGVQQPKHLLVLGDSIAAHFGVADGAGYDTHLTQLLQGTGERWNSTNWGVSGYTSEDLVTHISRKAEEADGRATLEAADLICISIGGNNLLRLLGSHGLDSLDGNGEIPWSKLAQIFTEGSDSVCTELKEDLGAIMRLIRKYNPDATVLVQNIHNVARDFEGGISLFGKPLSVAALADRFFDPILRVIDEGAAEYGYHVADTYGAFSRSAERPLLRRELIHPNEAGHRLIAGVLFDKYTEARLPITQKSEANI